MGVSENVLNTGYSIEQVFRRQCIEFREIGFVIDNPGAFILNGGPKGWSHVLILDRPGNQQSQCRREVPKEKRSFLGRSVVRVW